MKKYIHNPKVQGSGMITCIPQSSNCPVGCKDCFFQSGRSYLEPLDKNLPNIPTLDEAKGRIVRVNDGNDSNVERDLVERTVKCYDDYFFNTSIPKDLDEFSGPVVLTLNPAGMTDKSFHIIPTDIPNIMYLRIRANSWNLLRVVMPAIEFYTPHYPIVLTWMAYYGDDLPEDQKHMYEWKKRTLNSYWVIHPKSLKMFNTYFDDNPRVYTCGYKNTHSCSACGNCIREYYATKERMRDEL